MNGDFGASVDEDSSSQQSQSPTARMYAPTKQPLKSVSGKHWIKPNRNALSNPDSGSSEDLPPSYEVAIDSPRTAATVPPLVPPARPTQVRAVSLVIGSANAAKDSPRTAANATKVEAVGKPKDLPKPANTVSPLNKTTEAIKSPTGVAVVTSNTASPNTSPNVPSTDRPSPLDKQISYKYIPLELASATTTKTSIAKNILYQSLGHGLMVTKYGRQGGPKQRLLYCDSNVTKLYWATSAIDADQAHSAGIESLFDPSKTIALADVLEVRAGTDIDPETSLAALKHATKHGNQAAMVMKQKREAGIKAGTSQKDPEKRKSIVGSFFGSHEKEDELLYATATLRKKAKPEEFSKCLSLITNDRTVDIQCATKKDYNMLYINLKEIVNKLRNPTAIPASLAPQISEFRETLSTKKSVRFTMDDPSADSNDGESKDGMPSPNTAAAKAGGGGGGGGGVPGTPRLANASFISTSGKSTNTEVYQLQDDDSLDKLLVTPAPRATPSPNHSSDLAAAVATSTAQRVRSASEELSDSGHDPHTFSDEQRRQSERELVRTLSGISGLTLDVSPKTSDLDEHYKDANRAKSPYRMKAHEALQIGLILSQQEQQFGTNMYQSLQPEDEPEIEELNSQGFSTEEAILKIFQKRYQPELLLEEEQISPMSQSGKSEKGFDYGDEFAVSGDTFSGSVKSMFGRPSSFFPQVFGHGTEVGSGSQSSTEQPVVAEEEVSEAKKKPFFSMAQRHKEMMMPQERSPTKSNNNPILRLSSSDALQIGLLLSQQEEEHGVNMYDSLEVSDEATIRKLCQQGYSNDEAVLEIFNRKFGKTGPETKWSTVSMATEPVTSRLPPTAQKDPSPAPVPPPVSVPRPVVVPIRSPSPAVPSGSFNDTPPTTSRTSFDRSPPTNYVEPVPPQPQTYQPAHRRGTSGEMFPPPSAFSDPAPQSPPGAYPSGGSNSSRQSSFGSEGVAQRQPQYQQEMQQSPYDYQQQHQQSQYPPQYQEQPLMYRPAPINTQPNPRQAMQRTNSLSQSSFFPNDPNAMRPQYATNPNGQQQMQQMQQQGQGPPQRGLTRQSSMLSPRTVSRSNMLTTLTDDEAVNMALMLSQQETDHGINMYDSLRASDEQELQNLIASGYTNEQAVLFIFEKRYPPRVIQQRPQAFAHQRPPEMTRQSMYNMHVPPQQQPDLYTAMQQQQQHVGPYMQQQPGPYMQQPMLQPGPYIQQGYGPPPVRPGMPRQQSMYAPPPVPMQSAYMHQHQQQPQFSPEPPPAGGGHGHDPRLLRPPGAGAAPMQRHPSMLIPVRHDPSNPPVVSVVSAVPLRDADERNMISAQAMHVGYSSNNSIGSGSASAVTASPVQLAPRSATSVASVSSLTPGSASAVRSNPRPSSNSSVSSISSPPKQLVKKRSIFNFVTSGNGGEHTSGERPRCKDADVRTITKMGYTKDQAVWALLQSNNNLPMAIEALCNS